MYHFTYKRKCFKKGIVGCYNDGFAFLVKPCAAATVSIAALMVATAASRLAGKLGSLAAICMRTALSGWWGDAVWFKGMGLANRARSHDISDIVTSLCFGAIPAVRKSRLPIPAAEGKGASLDTPHSWGDLIRSRPIWPAIRRKDRRKPRKGPNNGR